MSKLLSHRGALCNVVRRIAVEAGELILEYYDGVKDAGHSEKSDGSPVTLADQEAEKLIEKKLAEILPDIPVIGEEAYEGGMRLNFDEHPYFWLVDPLDGTRAFIRGDGDFTVNIALIHNHEPVLGVLYAPESGEMYAGFMNEDESVKSFRYFEDTDNEKDMRTRSMPSKGLTVMSSSHYAKVGAQDAILSQFKVSKILKRSSSIKIAMIANAKADMYLRLGPTSEWDTAAGHAILRAAGGDIIDLQGQSLKYGMPKDDSILNPDFIAASGDILKHIELSGD